jgi:excisionase family DNA binding protein
MKVRPEEYLLTVNDIARWLNCHPMTVRSLTSGGVLKCTHVGTAVRFTRKHVTDYIKSQES